VEAAATLEQEIFTFPSVIQAKAIGLNPQIYIP
jgi:hypothetical protein